MFPIKFPEINSERLLLREPKERDASELVEIIGFNVPSPDEHKAIAKVQETKTLFQKQDGITWVVIYKNALVGTVGFYRGFANKTGEIGYVMKKKYQRLGIMSEACEMVMNYGFKTLKLTKITAFTPIENLPSVNMLLSLGFANSNTRKDSYTIFEVLKPVRNK
jgi:ribosomal-protein-alanine N-acetyltransferase